MKTIFSSVKHSYLAKIGILLIVIALVAGILSCEPGDTYELIMAENPAGGGTATDETGGSPYGVLESVDIKAVAAPCHRFVNWEAPVGIFGNATAAETTFIMPAQDVIVTANFEPIPADHYKFYTVDWDEGLYVGKEVLLVDQFGTFNATVGDPLYLGNPVKKVHNDMVTPISDDNRHFMFYELDYGKEEPMLDSWQVVVKNQFGENQELTVIGPVALAVPTTKEGHEEPECLNHYLVYDAYGPLVNDEVFLKDQFTEEWVVVDEAWYFANPVQKTIIENGEVTEIEDQDPHGHLVFYRIDGEPIEKSVQIDNQFGNRTLDLIYPELLAVPSEKTSWEQPLNHFKTYWAEWALEAPPQWEPPLPVDVQLEDQFVTINATVTGPTGPFLFANPTSKEKMVGEEEFEWTPVSDWKDHLTLYDIEPWADPQEWDVTVNNQFGINQVLRVAGPFYLAVPTGKLTPDWPTDVNHFLVYDVYYKEYPSTDVYIRDQFINGETTVYEPAFFAVPTQKTHDGVVTPIVGDDHLLFYWIDGIDPLHMYNLPVVNQFGEQYLDVDEHEGNFLGVPSQKVDSAGPYLYDPPF